MKIHLIGLDDNREQHFSPEVNELIARQHFFSGGVRHYEIMKPYLPAKHTWVPITVPLDNVFSQYEGADEIVIFASGDPLFFGFGNTVLRRLPDADVKLYPYFNSLQLLAHRLLLPYQDMHIVSLTGRPWQKLDEALIMGYEKIGVLTDNKLHTPSTIAARLLEYGYDNYRIAVGELLGNSEKERVTEWNLDEVVGKTFEYPNNLILQRTRERARPFGIPEGDFHLLNGRAKMITKMPIRLLSMSMLDLRYRKVFWDVGFCTGSVSIEAKLQFPHLQIISFEKRPEGEKLLQDNASLFGTPGIEGVIGDFSELDLSDYPAPDAVFIGGHGGKMAEIMKQIASRLKDGGNIVFNSVSEQSRQMFIDALEPNGLKLTASTLIKIDDHNIIEVMKAEHKN